MHRMIAWALAGVLALLLAAPARAQQHIPYDEFRVNDEPPTQRPPRGPHGNPGPSQTITGETLCKQGCPTGTQGFTGADYPRCVPLLEGWLIPKTGSCTGGRPLPKDPDAFFQAIAEHFALQDCFWMIRNSTQAQDRPMMENIKRCRDREMAPGVPAPLRAGLEECWGLIYDAYDKSFEAWEGFRRGGTGLRGKEITALRREAQRKLDSIPGCLGAGLRRLDGFLTQEHAEDGPPIAQEHHPNPPRGAGRVPTQSPFAGDFPRRSAGRGHGRFPPPGEETQPPPSRPSPEICNLRDLAALVFERYETGNPIGIVQVKKIGGMPPTIPTYLVVLSGTEHLRLDAGIDQATWTDQATWLAEDVSEANNLRSAYRQAILEALKRRALRPGTRILVAGHSLGGMVGQNLVADPRFKELRLFDHDFTGLGLVAERVITFGSPYTRTREPINYVHVEARGDPIPGIVNVRVQGTIVRIDGRGPLDWKGNHLIYPTSAELAEYDLLGRHLVGHSGPAGGTGGRRGEERPPSPPHSAPTSPDCWEVDRKSFKAYAAPRLQEDPTSEEIGELAMQAMAHHLGYVPVVPPAEASDYRQGYDGIYWDPDPQRGPAIVIGEAKGGYNGKPIEQILGCGYDERQGTIEWARKAAMRITRSRTTSDKEVKWAEMILCALDTKRTDKDTGEIKPPLAFCEQWHSRTPRVKVRIEVFHTEIYDRYDRGQTKHVTTAEYPRGNLLKLPSCE